MSKIKNDKKKNNKNYNEITSDETHLILNDTTNNKLIKKNVLDIIYCRFMKIILWLKN